MNLDSIKLDGVERLDACSYRVSFDAQLYSQMAVKKAVYKFAANFAAVLRLAKKSDIHVYVDFPAATPESEQSAMLGAFLNEVIDQDLRERIAKDTESIRNLILAEAFSKTSLLNPEE